MIPYAILSGTVYFSDENSIDIRILDLSVDSFTFRLPKKYHEKVISRLRLQFLSFDKCTRNEIMLVTGEDMEIAYYLTNTHGSSKSTDSFFDLYKISVKNAKSEDYVKILTGEYMNYVNLKLAGDDGVLSKELVGYPAELDAIYPGTVQEWRESCLKCVESQTFSYAYANTIELALNLSTPDLLKKYVELEWADFLIYIEKEYYLGKIPLASDSRLSDSVLSIYIGNQFDTRLLPDEALLARVINKANSLVADGFADFKLVLQLPPMKESQIPRYEKLIKLYLQNCIRSEHTLLPEVVVNDIGLCELLREHFPNQMEITLGILLNKRRKDVRLPYKKGYQAQVEALKENALHAPSYQRMLMETYGIKKYSYEACEYPYSFAGEGHALHLPYFQMNTGGAADQNPDEFTFYPTHLHMIGKNNSLFGYDRRILTDPDYLQGFLKQKPSRIVLELI